MSYIKNVAIVGASGQQGQWIVEELLKTGKHDITAITRADSSGTVPDGVKTAIVNYEDPATLVKALQGKDCLIITMAVTAPRDTQTKLINAAIEAEVPWILPNEYGSDYTNVALAKDTFLGMGILAARKQIEDSKTSSFIAIACGFWYEYSLGVLPVCYGFDMKNREMTFYDDGNTKINTSTWAHVGRAVAKLLSLPIESSSGLSVSSFKNKPVRISSFFLSQKDMLEAVKRVTGTTDNDWTVKYQDVKERYEEGVKEFDGGKGNRMGFAKLLYARVFYPDGSGAFGETKGLHNEELGLPQDNLDEQTKIGVHRGLTGDASGRGPK